MRDVSRYPLSWPSGWTRRSQTKRAAFKASRSNVTVTVAVGRLDKQLRLLGATGEVLSSNVETRLDGAPKSGRAEPNDSGVALYVHHPDKGGNPETMAKINAAYATAKTEYVGATASADRKVN